MEAAAQRRVAGAGPGWRPGPGLHPGLPRPSLRLPSRLASLQAARRAAARPPFGPRPRRRACRAALAVAGAGGAGAKQPHMPRPAVLPTPPKSASLLDVLPYLVELALADRALWWRLGTALVLMVLSKGAGALGQPPLFF